MSRLVYSRSNPEAQIFDRRGLSSEVFVQPLAPIVKCLFREEILNARKRISVFYQGGKRFHSYIPSQEYVKTVKKLATKKY